MFRVIIFCLLIIFAVFAPLVYAGPQLVSDLMVGKDWRIAEDLTIKESKCTSYYFLVSTCNVEYLNRRDLGRVGGSLNYLVLGSWAGERLTLLRSSKEPNRVGSTIGLEHMQQRLVSFGVFVVVALLFLGGLLRFVVTAFRSDESAPTSGVPFDQPAQPATARVFGQRAAG